VLKLEVLLLGGCVNSAHGPDGLSSFSEKSLREIADTKHRVSAPAGVADDAHPRSGLRKSGGAQIKAPVPMSMPAPRYTPQARKDKVEGAIVAMVDVDAGGEVTGVRLTAVSLSRNLTDGLDQSVIDTVRAWRFRPATRTGKPVPVTVHVQVTFSYG